MNISNSCPTPTRQQVEEAEQLLAKHADGKLKLSKRVIEQLELILNHLKWHEMMNRFHPGFDHVRRRSPLEKREAGFTAMEEQRLSEQ